MLEAEFLVKMDRWEIVGEDRQFKRLDAIAIVPCIDEFAQQRRSDTPGLDNRRGRPGR